MHDFLEATGLPEASALSLPKTKPGVVRLTAPAEAAWSILRLEIFDPFMPAFRSFHGISQNACLQNLSCPATGQ